MMASRTLPVVAVLLLAASAGASQRKDMMTNSLFPSEKGPWQLRVALLGNPVVKVEWNDAQVRALKEAGFNAVQLNVAWGRRPHDEALNLRDVVSLPGADEDPKVAARRTELKRRNALAKKHGLRTIFHFGSPYMWRDPETGEVKPNGGEAFQANPPWFDVLNPKLVEYETALLKRFRAEFPDVDDILVYTYDQDAWQACEFDDTKLSRGIPLHERLPDYVRTLHAVWTEGRADTRLMWWEPWELSAGQVYRCLERMPREGFGLMLHANIAEVQLSMPVDVWFRNTARMARDMGIPVVAEGFFGAMNEEIEPMAIPAPRLVDEEILALTGVSGVVGLKEYFGIQPLVPDLNLDAFRARVKDKNASTEQVMDRITERFGADQARVRRLMDLLSEGYRMYPWDSTWFTRLLGTASVDHGWKAATLRGLMAETPSWRSTRHAHFMMVDDSQPHPWKIEDAQIRSEFAAEILGQAVPLAESLARAMPEGADRAMFEAIAKDADHFRRVSTSYALHLRQTNVAMLLRQDAEAKRPLAPRLVAEMERLLDADVENQGGAGRVVEMRKAFRDDPAGFVTKHLLVDEARVLERGYFTMTTR